MKKKKVNRPKPLTHLLHYHYALVTSFRPDILKFPSHASKLWDKQKVSKSKSTQGTNRAEWPTNRTDWLMGKPSGSEIEPVHPSGQSASEYTKIFETKHSQSTRHPLFSRESFEVPVP